MAQAPKKRLLPKNITEKPDAEIAERLFGKAAKKELDRKRVVLINARRDLTAIPVLTSAPAYSA